MRYESAARFRQALEQRLGDRTKAAGASLVRLRKTVVFDQLLARLAVAAPGRWVLKGGLALDFRLKDRSRTTKDMDLVRHDDEEAAVADLIEATSSDLGDFFAFSVEGRARLGEDEAGAVRCRVRAELAGRLFENVVVDIGFSDPLGWAPERVRGSDLLAFAGIEPVEVPVVSLEQQVAEKVHAFTRSYSGQPSSRARDLIDLVLIKKNATLDGARLHAALCGTFEGRGQHPLPGTFPPPPAKWSVAYRKLAKEVGLDTELAAGHREAAALLDPILGGMVSRRWDAAEGRWV
jgi:predicted nucleotidyltransferase component of viral defense system